jgi:TonB family protein
MPIVFASGETLGPIRFDSFVGRYQDHALYHARDEVKRRRVLIRQYAPEDPEQAMSALPAGGRHARSRWEQLLEVQLQRFELAHSVLPQTGSSHVSLIDHLRDDTFYAVMSHCAVGSLVAEFAQIKSPSEPALQQLLLPIIEVLSVLHKARVLYCGLAPEEILLDRSNPAGHGVPVIAGFGSVYHWGGMGPPRPRPGQGAAWAPEFYDRQAPLTTAADVYALGALSYHLMSGASPSPALQRLKGIEHPSINDVAGSYSTSLRRAVEHALQLDPAARPQSISAFRETALPAVTHPVREVARAPVRKRAERTAPQRHRPAPRARARVAPMVRAAMAALAGFLTALSALAAKLTPRIRTLARAPRPKADLRPNLQSARAQIAETFERLKPSRPAPRQRMRAPPRGWVKSGLVALRRQWQPMVAAAIVLGVAGAAWWLRNVEVWPYGPFERLAATSQPGTPVNTRTGQGALEQAEPKNDTRAAAEAPGQSGLQQASAPTQSALRQTASEAEADSAATPLPPETTANLLIAALQTELKRLGVFEGEIDGIDGPPVRLAITAAKAKFKLIAQPFPSRRLLARLKSQPNVDLPTAPLPAAPVAAPPEIKPAQPKRTVNPEYPHGALNRQIEGWVEVAYDVDPQGNVQNVRVSEAESERAAKLFSPAALKAVEATSFYPATADGKPVWSRNEKRRFRFAIKGR